MTENATNVLMVSRHKQVRPLKAPRTVCNSRSLAAVTYLFITAEARHQLLFLNLRVQVHAHACIFGWLLGDCISESTADIPRNQRPML